MQRRNFGSVRKLPSGRWQASYYHEGKRHTAPGTFATKTGATGWLAEVQADIRRGAWSDPTASVTVAQYARSWLKARTDLRPTSRSKYTSLLEGHILPAFGAVPLRHLSSVAVRSWWAQLSQRYPVAATDAYRLLAALCRSATEDRIIPLSPCNVKGASAVRHSDRPVATVAEVQAAVEHVPERFRAAVLLAAWCQLRRGEVLGLQREDVDLDRCEITVRRTVLAESAVDSIYIAPPKTAAGRRTITVPPHVVPALRHHLATHVAADPGAWLFTRPTGEVLAARTLDDLWKRARNVIGRPDLRLHDLRHSGLTWAAAAGATTAELMYRAGHASPTVALHYQHATRERDRSLAEALAGMARDANPRPSRAAAPIRARIAHAGGSST